MKLRLVDRLDNLEVGHRVEDLLPGCSHHSDFFGEQEMESELGNSRFAGS
jgi:hypothetical protein